MGIVQGGNFNDDEKKVLAMMDFQLNRPGWINTNPIPQGQINRSLMEVVQKAIHNNLSTPHAKKELTGVIFDKTPIVLKKVIDNISHNHLDMEYMDQVLKNQKIYKIWVDAIIDAIANNGNGHTIIESIRSQCVDILPDIVMKYLEEEITQPSAAEIEIEKIRQRIQEIQERLSDLTNESIQMQLKQELAQLEQELVELEKNQPEPSVSFEKYRPNNMDANAMPPNGGIPNVGGVQNMMPIVYVEPPKDFYSDTDNGSYGGQPNGKGEYGGHLSRPMRKKSRRTSTRKRIPKKKTIRRNRARKPTASALPRKTQRRRRSSRRRA